MSGVQNIQVHGDDAGIRLDRWFKRHFPGLGHGRLEKFLRKGQIRVDGKRAKSRTRLDEGQSIRIPPYEDKENKKPSGKPKINIKDSDLEALRNSILHQDDHVIAINKPAGLAVQGGTGTHKHIDAMLETLQFEKRERPKLVHRLDKDTSGVLILARTTKAATALTQAFKSKDVLKIYWGIVVGVPKPRHGRIDIPLQKRPARKGEKVVADEDGRRAVTYYHIIENAARKAAWLAMMPETGRTHQLRVHCAELRTPILGDGKYGGREAFLEGAEGVADQLHLHAKAIRIKHPVGGLLEIMAPLSDHMKASWKYFGFDESIAAVPFDGFEDA